MAAEVLCQRVAVFRIAGGGQIGEDVCAAKAVNSLLGVAHQKQGGAPVLLHEGSLKNGILQRVGVLKFVYQRGLPVARQGFGKGGGIGGMLGECVEHVQQQIVKAAFGAAFFFFFGGAAQMGDKAVRQIYQDILFRCGNGLCGFAQRAQCAAQQRDGGGFIRLFAFFEGFFELVFQRGRGKQVGCVFAVC